MKNTLLVLILSFIFAAVSLAQIPKKLSYQGAITDDLGNPLSGNQMLTLKLYNVGSGGTALWEETQNVNVISGVFNVILGEVTPLNLPFDAQYWLGITVAPNPAELSPRMQLTAAAYSMNSLTVADPSISPWKTSGSTVYYDEGPVYIGRSNSITAAEHFGFTATAGASTYGGMYANTTNANGWPFYGYASGGVSRAWHYYQPSDSSWRLNNLNTGIVVKGDGRFGFRTSIPPNNFVIVHDQFTNPGGFGGLALIQTSNLNKWHLYVSQSTNVLRLYYNNAERGEFSSTTGAYSNVSDVRLKKNIRPLNGMLSIIDKLQPVEYQMIDGDDTQGISYGLIAQDVEKVIPDIISVIKSEDSAGTQDLKTISYTELIPILIKAMQEQQSTIEDLQKQIDELKRMR